MTGDRGPAPWPLWLRVVLLAAILAALGLPLWVWRADISRAFAERELVVAEIRAAGAWGPAVVIGLTAGQTIVAPIPGQVINFAAGYVYGPWLGLAASWTGMVLGSWLAMLLARRAGRPLVERLVSAGSLGRVDRLAAGQGLGFFWLCFLLPGLPDDLLCFVAGLTPLPLRWLLPIAALARLPGVAAAVWLGARAGRLPWPVWVVSGAIGLAAAVWLWRRGPALQSSLMERIGKL